MENFCSNNSNNKSIVDLILESLKSKINSIINNSNKKTYLKIKTIIDLYNWKNEIINLKADLINKYLYLEIWKLIHEEIDKFKYKLKEINNDLNQQEPIESEEHNGQNTRLGSQKEKCIILNQNMQLNDDKSYQLIKINN